MGTESTFSAAEIIIKCFLLFFRKCSRIFGGKAHENRFVRGITFNPAGNRLISVGDDKKILTWNLEDLQTVDYGDRVPVCAEPEDSVLSKVTETLNELKTTITSDEVTLSHIKQPWGMGQG